uniref:Uncharacterized protein n=1 Tax=Tanacetum cinerariifolium TaxID=118510 RepID=A0A6L2LJE5_TANCI|nr:hypothetical protein [Tanacetum cinerariifolium]
MHVTTTFPLSLRQIHRFSGDLSLGIPFPGDMLYEISQTEKLEGDTFPGRHRRAHIVSVKQLIATVEGFPERHVARDNDGPQSMPEVDSEV